ncbi:hypothetical protein GMSM_13040 [Geomonas sp. Red276]
MKAPQSRRFYEKGTLLEAAVRQTEFSLLFTEAEIPENVIATLWCVEIIAQACHSQGRFIIGEAGPPEEFA